MNKDIYQMLSMSLAASVKSMLDRPSFHESIGASVESFYDKTAKSLG